MTCYAGRIGLLVVGATLALGCTGCQQMKRVLSRRKFVWASHIGRADVRAGREIVPGNGHVFFYRRLKIKPYVGSHNRIYTQVYLSVRQLARLPVGQPVNVRDSAVTISGFVARGWLHDMEGFTGSVTRLSADTLDPLLKLRLEYTARGERKTLRRRLVFKQDTAYFRQKK